MNQPILFKKTIETVITVEPTPNDDWMNPNGRGQIQLLIRIDSPEVRTLVSLAVTRIDGEYLFNYDEDIVKCTDEIESAISDYVKRRFEELDRGRLPARPRRLPKTVR